MTTRSYRVGAIAVLLGLAAAPLQAAPGDVNRTLDAPCRYPTGLATDGTHLFVLDWREGHIYQLRVGDGGRVAVHAAPTLRPAGLTWGGGHLYVTDDHTGWIYAVALPAAAPSSPAALEAATQPAATVANVEFAFEGPEKQVTGLAYAEDGLWLLERKSGQISRVVPRDGTILAYIPTPTDTCTSLAHDGRHLWVGDRVKNEIYLVEPADGTVVGIVDAPGPYAAGLAWLDGHLWNADFQTRRLYQIKVRDTQKYRLKDAREARVEFIWGLLNYGPGEVRNATAALAIPESLPQQQLLAALEYASPPARFATDQWGQNCALYELGTLAAGTRRTLGYTVRAKISAIRYLIFPEDTGTVQDVPAEIRAQYLGDAERYRVGSVFARETVKAVVGDEKNCYRIARKIYKHIMEKLEYEMVGGWDVPEVVLKRGKGSCSEYTFAFIALCRAAGLPARYVGSVVVRGDDASIDEAFHRWAEVYLPNYGWIPVDANRGDQKSPADQARGFGELANRFLITTHSGGPSEHLDWGYNGFARYTLSGYAKVEEENFGLWEPLKPTTQPATAPGGPQPTDTGSAGGQNGGACRIE